MILLEFLPLYNDPFLSMFSQGPNLEKRSSVIDLSPVRKGFVSLVVFSKMVVLVFSTGFETRKTYIYHL